MKRATAFLAAAMTVAALAVAGGASADRFEPEPIGCSVTGIDTAKYVVTHLSQRYTHCTTAEHHARLWLANAACQGVGYCRAGETFSCVNTFPRTGDLVSARCDGINGQVGQFYLHWRHRR